MRSLYANFPNFIFLLVVIYNSHNVKFFFVSLDVDLSPIWLKSPTRLPHAKSFCGKLIRKVKSKSVWIISGSESLKALIWRVFFLKRFDYRLLVNFRYFGFSRPSPAAREKTFSIHIRHWTPAKWFDNWGGYLFHLHTALKTNIQSKCSWYGWSRSGLWGFLATSSMTVSSLRLLIMYSQPSEWGWTTQSANFLMWLSKWVSGEDPCDKTW